MPFLLPGTHVVILCFSDFYFFTLASQKDITKKPPRTIAFISESAKKPQTNKQRQQKEGSKIIEVTELQP